MIITSSEKLEINKIYTEKEINNKIFEYLGIGYKTYIFYVVREVTEKEYWNYVNSIYFPNKVFALTFFYEISMD